MPVLINIKLNFGIQVVSPDVNVIFKSAPTRETKVDTPLSLDFSASEALRPLHNISCALKMKATATK